MAVSDHKLEDTVPSPGQVSPPHSLLTVCLMNYDVIRMMGVSAGLQIPRWDDGFFCKMITIQVDEKWDPTA